MHALLHLLTCSDTSVESGAWGHVLACGCTSVHSVGPSLDVHLCPQQVLKLTYARQQKVEEDLEPAPTLALPHNLCCVCTPPAHPLPAGQTSVAYTRPLQGAQLASAGQEKVEGDMAPAPTPALEEARALALQAATAAGQVQADCGLQIAPEDFVAGALKWGLMEVLAWR